MRVVLKPHGKSDAEDLPIVAIGIEVRAVIDVGVLAAQSQTSGRPLADVPIDADTGNVLIVLPCMREDGLPFPSLTAQER